MKASPQGNPLQRSGGTPESLKRGLEAIGAQENNLKNLSVTIPANKFVVVTGLPVRASLPWLALSLPKTTALHGVSSYPSIRQPTKPEIDSLTGISPTVAIEQRRPGSRKSTVGSTEIANSSAYLHE